MTGDLHCHTTLSDGSLGIEEVIVQAKRMGLDFLAITDHDTLSSSNRAQILGERHSCGRAFRMGQEAQFKSTHSLLCTAEARQAGRSLPEVMPDKKRLCKGNDRKGNGKISYPCRCCTALHEKFKEHFQAAYHESISELRLCHRALRLCERQAFCISKRRMSCYP